MFKDIAPKPKTGGVARARKLRKQMSLPEVLLWRLLRPRPFGLTFRAQHPTGEYTLDFYCNDARLAIEIDGMVHDDPVYAAHDRARDDWLRARGIDTLRIPASEVLANVAEAASAIVEYARARLPLHHPAAPGGPPPRDKLGEDRRSAPFPSLTAPFT
jgi:very-short-patch-repair endonuclease